MKTLLIAACVCLLNGCPFLPPSPYQRYSIGTLPLRYTDLSPGQSLEGSVAAYLPGSVDMTGVSSALDGELLAATFHLRELPEEAENRQRIGHWDDIKYRWTVLIDIEGDAQTSLDYRDFQIDASFYDPELTRVSLGRVILSKPWFQIDLSRCYRSIAEHNGAEFTRCDLLPDKVKVSLSQEDGTLTLAARIPGITDESTIAFWTHDFSTYGQDYLPRDK